MRKPQGTKLAWDTDTRHQAPEIGHTLSIDSAYDFYQRKNCCHWPWLSTSKHSSLNCAMYSLKDILEARGKDSHWRIGGFDCFG